MRSAKGEAVRKILKKVKTARTDSSVSLIIEAEVMKMDTNQLIGKALTYIGKEWKNEGLTLEQVADAAGFSLNYFDRLFAAKTGLPVMEYVRGYRLIRSAEMLRSTDMSILSIALELGYANPESYTRAFREHYGMPPSEYRDTNRKKALTWKDLSTGTVVRRFQNECPDLVRVDADEAIDAMLTSRPLFYLYTSYLLTQTDNAVFTLRAGNCGDFIIVDEYRPDEMSLQIVCEDPERLAEYTAICRKFDRSTVEYICSPDAEPAAFAEGFDGYIKKEYWNYVYSSTIPKAPADRCYSTRILEESDRKEIENLARYADASVPLLHVFDQNFLYHNYGVTFIGLFTNNRLVGCAMPGLDRVRNYVLSDIGSVVLNESHRSFKALHSIWTAAIRFALEHHAMPVNFAVSKDTGVIGRDAAERMGYQLVSKKIVYCRDSK